MIYFAIGKTRSLISRGISNGSAVMYRSVRLTSRVKNKTFRSRVHKLPTPKRQNTALRVEEELIAEMPASDFKHSEKGRGSSLTEWQRKIYLTLFAICHISRKRNWLVIAFFFFEIANIYAEGCFEPTSYSTLLAEIQQIPGFSTHVAEMFPVQLGTSERREWTLAT
jgi:hypothetical protein